MNRRSILLTSLCILLPVIAGTVLWERLPDSVPTHFGFDGAANGWSSKTFAVFGLPLFLLAVHLICVFATLYSPKRENINGKMLTLILWICPAVSILTAAVIYPNALGYAADPAFPSMLFMGVLFLVIGNRLPKCRRNYVVGIKLPWTLHDDDNWNRTHRMAGRLWTVAGLIIILCAFFHAVWLMILTLSIAGIAPVVYSFALYIRTNRYA